MLAYAQLYITIGIISAIFIAFVLFAMIAAGWYRLYLNKHEPVYVLENAKLVKNHIASRFCKIVITNTIKDQCLRNVENIGVWTLIQNLKHPSPTTIDSIQNLHYWMLNAIKDDITEHQYTTVASHLNQIDTTLVQHLTKSEISTPPYFTMNTYLLWVGDGLYSFNK